MVRTSHLIELLGLVEAVDSVGHLELQTLPRTEVKPLYQSCQVTRGLVFVKISKIEAWYDL